METLSSEAPQAKIAAKRQAFRASRPGRGRASLARAVFLRRVPDQKRSSTAVLCPRRVKDTPRRR